jgi:sugar/nucleoside kinase (ribokinase family)
MTRAIFIGLSTIDIVYNVDDFPSPNTKITANSQDVYVGGPAANACVAFAHLGGRPTLVTSVGRHALAHVVREEMERHSIQLVDLNPEFHDVPVISSVAVDGAGQRNVISANAIRIAPPSARVDEQLLGEARMVMVDGHFMQACQAWAAAARSRKIPVVLDGGSWKVGTEELLADVHTAICSADFLPPGCAQTEEVLEFLRMRGVTNMAVTNGARPIHFRSGQSSGTMTAPQVDVVDSMGAGDILHGAFCYLAATGLGFIESLGEAANIAAESCRYRGTREWMKSITARKLNAELKLNTELASADLPR